eukprot:scaffold11779_cov39-Cyclotella_meneghiniana.AAC.2
MGGGGVYLSFELSDVSDNVSTYIVPEAVFEELQPDEVDELVIFVFGRVGDTGANTKETEAAMTPQGE